MNGEHFAGGPETWNKETQQNSRDEDRTLMFFRVAMRLSGCVLRCSLRIPNTSFMPPSRSVVYGQSR